MGRPKKENTKSAEVVAMPAPGQAYTSKQAAFRLNCSERQVRRLVELGRLKAGNIATGVDNDWRISAASLDAFFENGTGSPAEEEPVEAVNMSPVAMRAAEMSLGVPPPNLSYRPRACRPLA